MYLSPEFFSTQQYKQDRTKTKIEQRGYSRSLPGDVLMPKRCDLSLGSANRRNDEECVVLLSLTCAVVHISINLYW